MATKTVTESTFEETISKGVVLLDFWAAWCGPCRAFAPVFEQASERHGDVTFGKIDTEAEPSLAGGLGISAIPTLMAFRDGILLFERAGAVPGQALDDLISGLKALDMDEVRKKVAEAEAEEEEEEEKDDQDQDHDHAGKG